MPRYYQLQTSSDSQMQLTKKQKNNTGQLLNQPNVEFYLNKRYITHQKLSIMDVHLKKSKDYEWLEQQHDYIQWLFPNHFASMFNSKSYPLSKQQAQIFRKSKIIGERLVKSFQLYCNFIGLKVDCGARTFQTINKMRLVAALVTYTHNHLRIRRILTSLSVNGFRVLALWFLQILKSLVRSLQELRNSTELQYSFQNQWMIYSQENSRQALQYCQCTKQDFNKVNPYLRQISTNTKCSNTRNQNTSESKMVEQKRQIPRGKTLVSNISQNNKSYQHSSTSQRQDQKMHQNSKIRNSVVNGFFKTEVERARIRNNGEPCNIDKCLEFQASSETSKKEQEKQINSSWIVQDEGYKASSNSYLVEPFKKPLVLKHRGIDQNTIQKGTLLVKR